MNTTFRIAVVTGHSQGLGQAVTLELLTQGWRVLGLSRSGWPHAEASVHPGLVQVPLDLSDPVALAGYLAGSAWADALRGAHQAWLVNNAGTVSPMGPAGVQGAAAVAQAVALNVAAPLMLADAFAAATRAVTEGVGVDRRVVHIASGAARNPYAGWSIYCATKAALDMHARATQLDAVGGLRIESLAPGVVDTGMQAQIRSTGAERFPHVARFQAMHRDGGLASAAGVARRLVAHLGSDAFGRTPVTDLRDLPE